MRGEEESTSSFTYKPFATYIFLKFFHPYFSEHLHTIDSALWRVLIDLSLLKRLIFIRKSVKDKQLMPLLKRKKQNI